MNKSLTLVFLLCMKLSLLSAHVYYVAPNGNDANPGTISSPFESISKAQQWVQPGDTVFIRGGLYKMRPEQISGFHGHYSPSNKAFKKGSRAASLMYASVIKLEKSGQPKAPIRYWAYPGETPVFDFTDIRPEGKRIIAFNITGNYIHIKGIEIIGVQVTVLGHTQSECFEITGSNNTLENTSMHDGMAIGVYILDGSNNLVLNCDAYKNFDPVSEDGRGGNVDGFGCHVPKGATNNIFRGCRAWFNSDDGFDFINSSEAVLVDHCWAFYNGYSKGFVSQGDGNGFKAGGYGSTHFKNISQPIPRNTLQFCLAVKNKQSGFYANHHLNGNNWYNNTAFANKRNYNMLNRKSLNKKEYLTDVPGWGHLIRNNLGYKANSKELINIDTTFCDVSHNSFDLELNIDDSDFISLDEGQLMAPRKTDGCLPTIDFMHLCPESNLIDKGAPLGFSFTGELPDLGCFEFNTNTQNKTDVSLFMRADSLQYLNKIQAKSGDLFKAIGHHGPAVENEWLAFRLYFDHKAAIDLYSKKTPGLELKKHRWYPSLKAQKNGAGADYYKVGSTVGLGGVRLWDGEKVIPLNPVSNRSVRVVKEGTSSFMEMLSEAVPYQGKKIDVFVRVTVYSGIREAKVEAHVLGNIPVQFVTGINYHKGQHVVKEANKIYVWGLHPEDVAAEKVALGAAILFHPKDFSDSIDDGKQQLIISKPTKYMSSWISAVNEQEETMNTLEKFATYLASLEQKTNLNTTY